jgi:hypothetical protein
MGAKKFERIARELPELLDRQLQALVGRRLSDFTRSEGAAYEDRKRKILQLRAQLEKLRKAR